MIHYPLGIHTLSVANTLSWLEGEVSDFSSCAFEGEAGLLDCSVSEVFTSESAACSTAGAYSVHNYYYALSKMFGMNLTYRSYTDLYIGYLLSNYGNLHRYWFRPSPLLCLLKYIIASVCNFKPCCYATQRARAEYLLFLSWNCSGSTYDTHVILH